MTVKVSSIINARLDAFDSAIYLVVDGLREQLKDYFSDIDEELAKLRKPKPKEHESLCWYCEGHFMIPMDDAPKDWFICGLCGATKCLNPTKVHGLHKVHWEGRGGR